MEMTIDVPISVLLFGRSRLVARLSLELIREEGGVATFCALLTRDGETTGTELRVPIDEVNEVMAVHAAFDELAPMERHSQPGGAHEDVPARGAAATEEDRR
jgi:hypothetical protein